MKDLPTELASAVVENINSIADLLSLRSVNTMCHLLVTPHVFREIHVFNSVQSAQNCQRILNSPSLAIHVREIVYDPRDLVHFCLLPGSLQDYRDELEIAELEDVLTMTFCSLPGFNNLESIVLNFWPSSRSQCGTEIQEHPFWFANRQITVLHAVHHSIKSSRIRSLTVNNVILTSSTSYFVSTMTNSPLRHFTMSVVANSKLCAWSGSKALNGSLNSLLPPSNANLKTLALRSPQGLYHSLSTQLHSFNYPALETLVLENIVFDPTPSREGIEEFIIRHKASLHRLELRSCSSYVPSLSAPVRRWSTIWKRFEEELVSLREIVVGDFNQGYAFLNGSSGYIPHPSLPSGIVEEDERSHSHFCSCVNLRRVPYKTHD